MYELPANHGSNYDICRNGQHVTKDDEVEIMLLKCSGASRNCLEPDTCVVASKLYIELSHVFEVVQGKDNACLLSHKFLVTCAVTEP